MFNNCAAIINFKRIKNLLRQTIEIKQEMANCVSTALSLLCLLGDPRDSLRCLISPVRSLGTFNKKSINNPFKLDREPEVKTLRLDLQVVFSQSDSAHYPCLSLCCTQTHSEASFLSVSC